MPISITNIDFLLHNCLKIFLIFILTEPSDFRNKRQLDINRVYILILNINDRHKVMWAGTIFLFRNRFKRLFRADRNGYLVLSINNKTSFPGIPLKCFKLNRIRNNKVPKICINLIPTHQFNGIVCFVWIFRHIIPDIRTSSLNNSSNDFLK